MIKFSDLAPDLQYAGFRKDGAICSPHFCTVIFQDQGGNYFWQPKLVKEFLIPYRDSELQIFKDDIYFLTSTEIQSLNQQYEISTELDFESLYLGADKYLNAQYHCQPVEKRHFIFGTQKEIGNQLENEYWDRIARCAIDAEKFLDLIEDKEKKIDVLGKLLKNFEDRMYSDRAQELVAKIEALKL